jgi:hypothetical protein
MEQQGNTADRQVVASPSTGPMAQYAAHHLWTMVQVLFRPSFVVSRRPHDLVEEH